MRLQKAPPGRGARVGTGEVPVEDAEDAAPGNDDPLAEVVLKFKNDLTAKNKEREKNQGVPGRRSGCCPALSPLWSPRLSNVR